MKKVKNLYSKKWPKTIASIAVSVALGLGSMNVLAASNTSGALSGTVTSSSNARVGSVKVTITSKSTGVIKVITSDAQGNFQLPKLPVGDYVITAEKPGFETTTSEAVHISIGEKTNVNIVLSNAGETLTVVGAAVTAVDTTSTETSLVMTEAQIDRLPVARNTTAVALLAPGTTRGDGAFGNLASFGGSSVGENAYYINGMNLTNFRNGLGGSTVPFEFYQEFQVKTGGYSAEFGRSTGGVINGVTKSGSNEFKAGISLQYIPDGLNEKSPTVYAQNGDLFIYNDVDAFSSTDINVYASGAIIEDKLFYYVLFNPRSTDQEYAFSRGTQFDEASADNQFWGTKIDWYITDDHHVELTAFSDSNEASTLTYGFDATTDTRGALVGETITNTGGNNVILKYTGYINDDLVVSTMWGKSEYDRTSQSPLDSNPVIGDSRGGGFIPLGNWVNFVAGSGFDTREATRIDFDYSIGDHELRFGVDREVNTAEDSTFYSGHNYYRYFTDPRSATGESVRHRVFEGGGTFETISSAIYIEDTWSLNDNITLRLGLRNEAFDNKNANGESFIKISNQLAPRLGMAYDINGDGEKKVFVNYGRYHLPIAANTNIRLAGAELFTQDFYQLDGVNSDGTPIFDPANLIDTQVFGDGTVPDTRAVKDANIEPMYQDEFILGYEQSLGEDWSVSARLIHRDLKKTIEDVAIDAAVLSWAADNGLATTLDGTPVADVWTGFHQYVLTNPGNDMRIYLPEFDQFADLSAARLNYPESKRKYNAFNLVLDKAWDNVWTANISYTWAHSYGNNEGYVRSDNGQDDAGLTTLFDQPGLLDGAAGNLPNDRRHSLKMFGAYQMTDSLRLSLNYLYETGRPINAFGVHPTDVFAAAYGAESFYQNGQLVRRGSRGRTASITQIDFGVTYETEINGYDLTVKADIFNLFDSANIREVVETAELGTGAPDPLYLAPTSFQTPRYVRLYVSMDF